METGSPLDGGNRGLGGGAHQPAPHRKKRPRTPGGSRNKGNAVGARVRPFLQVGGVVFMVVVAVGAAATAAVAPAAAVAVAVAVAAVVAAVNAEQLMQCVFLSTTGGGRLTRQPDARTLNRKFTARNDL